MAKTYKTEFKKFSNNTLIYRSFAMVFVFWGFVYLIWLFNNLNPQNMYLALAFFLVQIINYFVVSLSMFNHWTMRYSPLPDTELDSYPDVATIIPVYNEPLKIVAKTIKSAAEVEYKGKHIILISNDNQDHKYIQRLQETIWKLDSKKADNNVEILLRTSSPHHDAKAGNLNQAVAYMRKYYPHIDFVLTQDADEIAYPQIFEKMLGYFKDPKVAFVQSIKQVKVPKSDPFGNRDYMFYARTAPARDADNSMFACGSGVIWRLSAVESVGGFNTWNLVEDLTTSYELLANGWYSRYHYEPLSKGLAPEDLPNFVKQRGTWAIDTMRLFFWKNPIFKKGLSFKQKMHFLEIPAFYINGVTLMFLVLITSFCLLFEIWPTRATATEHAVMLLPSFVALEFYYLALADKIPFHRTRQFWVGLAPVYLVSVVKALAYGPNRKPAYKVTRKTNAYGNYLLMAWPQIAVISIVLLGVLKSVFITPIYSAFDWATFFWGIYIASFFVQFVKISLWKWRQSMAFSLGAQRRVTLSYAPEIL